MTWSPFKKPETQPANNGEQNKSEVDQLIEKLNTSFEEKLTAKLSPLSQTVQDLKTEWDGVKQAATNPPEKQEERQPADINTDPERWAAEKLTPLQMQVITTNARITENAVLSELDKQWNHLLPSIRDYFEKTPWQRKALPDYQEYCRNIVSMLVGKEAMKSGLRYDSEGKRFFLEDATSRNEQGESLFSPDLTWQDPRSGRVMRPEDQLAKLGIDPKQFSESVKKGLV